MSLTLNSQLNYDDFLRGYAIAIFSIWGIVVDIPRLLIRYGKAYPSILNVHSILMVMLGLLTIMYTIAQIAVLQSHFGSSYSGLTGLPLAQFIMSIILNCFILVQFILGLLVRVEMFKNKLSTSLFTIKLIHKIFGNITVIFGKIVATFVVYINTSQGAFKAWIFFLVALAILSLVMQIVYRSQSRSIIFQRFFKHKNKNLKYHTEIYQNLLDKRQKFYDFKQQGVRYIIFDNNMYYIDQDFMHPGGEHIFTILNGKQINYYIKGAKAISPNYPRHQHTKYVTKYLENRFIGQLSVEPLLINLKLPNDIVDWKIQQCLKTNYAGTYAITFKNESGYVRQNLKVQNFGKYIMMGCSTQQILNRTQRPYYMCLSISTYQKAILDRYRKYYKYYYYNQLIQQDDKKFNVQSLSQKISFFIKQHRRGLFTRYLLNAPRDRIFNINGPYGKGLGLKQKSSDYYLIITGGIGIVPFIDLFTYLLQKTLHDLIKIKASNPSLRKINQDNINYDSLNDIKILLIGTFTNSQKFYLSTPIKQLYYLNKKHSLKNFNMMIHYQNAEAQHQVKMIKDNFNKDFFINLIEEQQPDKIIYSGPNNIQEILRKTQPELKIKNPIYYL